MLLGLLSLWVVGRLGFVCLLGSLSFPGLLVLISVEVRRIWEVYDESLSFIPPAFWRGIRSSLWLVMFLLLGVFGRFLLRFRWFGAWFPVWSRGCPV